MAHAIKQHKLYTNKKRTKETGELGIANSHLSVGGPGNEGYSHEVLDYVSPDEDWPTRRLLAHSGDFNDRCLWDGITRHGGIGVGNRALCTPWAATFPQDSQDQIYTAIAQQGGYMLQTLVHVDMAPNQQPSEIQTRTTAMTTPGELS